MVAKKDLGYDPLPPMIGWVGGKKLLAKEINKVIETVPHDKYIEPMVGGGSVYLYKRPTKRAVLNDINKSLTQFLKQVKKGDNLSRCNFKNAKKRFSGSKKKLEKGTASMCDFLLLNKNSFASKMEQYTDTKSRCKVADKNKCGIYQLEKRYDRYVERLKNASITNTDYRKIVKKHDSSKSLTYFDPPYHEKIKNYYKDIDPEPVSPQNIAKTVKSMKGKAIVSFNDIPEVRKAFKDKKFHLMPIKTYYSMNSKSKNRHNKKELLITNFPTKCKWKQGKMVCPVKK